MPGHRKVILGHACRCCTGITKLVTLSQAPHGSDCYAFAMPRLVLRRNVAKLCGSLPDPQEAMQLVILVCLVWGSVAPAPYGATASMRHNGATWVGVGVPGRGAGRRGM